MFCFESAAQAVYLVSALDFKLRGPGLRLAGITTLFLDKTVNSHNAFLYLGVEMRTAKFYTGRYDRLTTIRTGSSRNTLVTNRCRPMIISLRRSWRFFFV